MQSSTMKLNIKEKLKHNDYRARLEIQIDKIVQHLIQNKSSFPLYFILLVIVVFAINVHLNGLYIFVPHADSYYIYTYTVAIFNDQNPYLRILS